MKISKASLLAAVSGLCIAGVAAAAEPVWPGAPRATERDKAVMLYFTKSFGGTERRQKTPLAFGLRYQQTSVIDASAVYPLMDVRYSLGGRKTVALGGALMLDSLDSSTDGSWRNPWLYVSVAAGLAVLLCAAEEVFCEDSPRRYESPPPTTPGTGT